MGRSAIHFLVFTTLGLAMILAWLGWATLRNNLLGWFLLITGLIYFFGVIIVYWVRGIQFWRPRAGGEIISEEQDDHSFWLIVLGMMAAVYLPPIEILFFAKRFPSSIRVQIAGLLVIALGAVLFIWARRALGRFYSGHITVIEDQPLVQQGPYRFIRHPAYAGYLLIALGLALGYSSFIGLAAILFLLMPSLIYRIHVEDQLLGKCFGAQFNEYARRTKRLLPYLW
jgi:protein-S-isoprenylcysteine O-methyltransferase Ste14